MEGKGKVAIVTGACGGGIGRSTALTLAREGYTVVLNYRSQSQAASQLERVIANMGGTALPVRGDVFCKAGCVRLVEQTLEAFGRVDVCIIGPGAGWNCEPVEELDSLAALADVEQETAPLYHLLPLIVPEMAKRHWGRLIAFSSNMDCPSPSYSYNAAKCARAQAVLRAAPALWEKGITANVISPGPVDPFDSLEEAVNACRNRKGEGRKISPQEIGEAVAFLCSSQADCITGNELKFQF